MNNNSAIVIQVNKITPIEGADRIQLVNLFGRKVGAKVIRNFCSKYYD